MILAGPNDMSNPGYLLLKASALQLPLRDNSIDLVIATPPHLNSKRFGKAGFCTNDPREYQLLLKRTLAECIRIMKPHACALVFTREGRSKSSKIFDVFQKRFRGMRFGYDRIASESFHVRYAEVEGFLWEALPISLYRNLIHRYSTRGEYVVHVFSGSGNSAIAAIQLARIPILIDLHYHKQTQARLNRRIPIRRT
jgi:DNA modification methylase